MHFKGVFHILLYLDSRITFIFLYRSDLVLRTQALLQVFHRCSLVHTVVGRGTSQKFLKSYGGWNEKKERKVALKCNESLSHPKMSRREDKK